MMFENMKKYWLSYPLLILSSLILTGQANAAQFSFEANQGTFWDRSAVNGSSNYNGWEPGKTEGTTTVDGITLTVKSTFANGAEASNNNLRIQTSGQTQGFVLGNLNGGDDENSGSLTNYQRVDFIFDTPVDLTDFKFADIDTDDRALGNDRFVDAVAAEGFNGSPGVTGSGLSPIYDLTSSELVSETIGGINYVSRDIDTYNKGNVQSNDPKGHAGISFNQGIDVASIYFFNDLNPTDFPNDNHSINLRNASISVQKAIPFEFSPSLGLLLSGASLFGVNYFRKISAKKD